MKDLRIDNRFSSACPKLTDEEFKKLEELIIKDNIIYNPILIWDNVIIDGHNRYRIAQQHHIEFSTKEITFDSPEEAVAWIKENAISQRNLNDYQRSVLVLELEDYYKGKAKERQLSTLKKGDEIPDKPILAERDTGQVRDQLAKKAGVSHGTIDKVKTIEKKADEETKNQLKKGETTINKEYRKIKEKKSKDEIDILESFAKSLERIINNYSDKECCFEFIPEIKEIIKNIRKNKTTLK